jgi:hypothetical protein
VRDAVAAAGAHAWLFRAEECDDQFIEFIEWQSDEAHPLIREHTIAASLEALHTAFVSEDSHTWVEARI